jgi:hypothetical protein
LLTGEHIDHGFDWHVVLGVNDAGDLKDVLRFGQAEKGCFLCSGLSRLDLFNEPRGEPAASAP